MIKTHTPHALSGITAPSRLLGGAQRRIIRSAIALVIPLAGLFASPSSSDAFPEDSFDRSGRLEYACPSKDNATCSRARRAYLRGVIRLVCDSRWSRYLNGLQNRLQALERRITNVQSALILRGCPDVQGQAAFRRCQRLQSNLTALQLQRSFLLLRIESLKLSFISDCNRSQTAETAAACNPLANETARYCAALVGVLTDSTKTAFDAINEIQKALTARCTDATKESAGCIPATATPTASATSTPITPTNTPSATATPTTPTATATTAPSLTPTSAPSPTATAAPPTATPTTPPTSTPTTAPTATNTALPTATAGA